jgi:hypothetical protein
MTVRSRLSVVAPLALTLSLFAGLAAVSIMVGTDPVYELHLEGTVFVLCIGLWALVQATVGTIIAWRRPDNRVGRIMQAAGPLLISVFLGFLVGQWRFVAAGPDDLLGALAAWWGSVAIMGAVFIALPLLGVLFPDGRLPSPRFAVPLAVLVVGILIPTILQAFATGPVENELGDNRLGIIAMSPEIREAANLSSTVSLIGGFVLAVAGIVVRWRRGDPLQRAQLKWLLGAFAIGSVLFAVSWSGPDDEPIDVVDVLSIASAMLVPLAVGVAVLRYHLYDIDRIISRTVSWALVSGMLVMVFAVLVVGLQTLLVGVTQAGTLAVVVSTLVAFALFQPLRRRVQVVVDRRFDRDRYDAERMATLFGERLRDRMDLDAVSTDLLWTAKSAMRPVSAALWLPGRGARR